MSEVHNRDLNGAFGTNPPRSESRTPSSADAGVGGIDRENGRTELPAVSMSLNLRMVQTDMSIPVTTRFHYSAVDPFEVRAEFLTTSGSVEWRFARDLLVEGLVMKSGDGDISVWPETTDEGMNKVYLCLDSPDGEALLEAEADDMADFVQAVTRAVPIGQESRYINMDLVLMMLLNEPDDFVGM
jgi:acylphosphatase